jgi:hypothetical protein
MFAAMGAGGAIRPVWVVGDNAVSTANSASLLDTISDGETLSLVLYVLFISKLIGGNVFPSFEPDGDARQDFSALIHQHAAGGLKDYAKLCFWAFLAGFNQNYAVDLINAVRNK